MRTGALPAVRRLLIGGALVVGMSSATAVASAESNAAAGCARQFEVAQRVDMESFRDYDAETFRDGHHPDAVTVFASGARRVGIDAIMAALAPHFADREAIWAWTELYRVVDGCHVGVHPVRHDLRHPVDRLPPARADRRDVHARRRPIGYRSLTRGNALARRSRQPSLRQP